jgi:hypothetical protein
MSIIRRIGNRAVLFVTLMALSAASSGQSATRYKFPANFILQATDYQQSSRPAIGINLINEDLKPFDSLEIRLYFTACDSDAATIQPAGDSFCDMALKPDLLIAYRADGFQDSIIGALRTAIWQGITSAKPCRVTGTDDHVSGKNTWYLPVRLPGISMRPMARIRLDLFWASREPTRGVDILDMPPRYIPSRAGGDWSWKARTLADGSPEDFQGVLNGTKDDVDRGISTTHSDRYIAVYRNGVYLWGFPPDWQTIPDIKIDTSHAIADPVPYAPIVIPLDEATGQLDRDSLNMRISRVRVNQAGYRPQDEKLFYCVGPATTSFSVIKAEGGSAVASGTLTPLETSVSGSVKATCYYNAQISANGQIFYQMQSPTVSGALHRGFVPDLPEGTYKIAVGPDTSAPFIIHDRVYSMVKDAMLKYFGIARCGGGESWFHPACHLYDPVVGGWHDAGDHLKIAQTIGHSFAVLGLCASALKDRDSDHYAKNQSLTFHTDGIPDVLVEAKVGADYVVNSYTANGDTVAGMITDLGEPGRDHGYWGRPEHQDLMVTDRGGPPRLTASGLGGNTCGSLSAGLAFVGKSYAAYDAAYAAKCIKIAKEIYAYGKANLTDYHNPMYSGGGISNDEMAFGALALWWATKEDLYKNDLLYDKTIGKQAAAATYPKGGFSGGWFCAKQAGMLKDAANLDFDNMHTYPLWGLYRLILIDEQTAISFGIDAAERLKLIENILYCQIANISDIGNGDQTVTLPASDFGWKGNTLTCSSLWGWMKIQQDWTVNRYQAGNMTELFCYYDVASAIQGISLPNSPASVDWKAKEVKSVLLKQLDYMLGLNPWDISMIMGVGSKNINHPHHRAANPELCNINYFYNYRPPVGALCAGFFPTTIQYDDRMGGSDGYFHSEISIDATTSLFLPVMGFSQTGGLVGARNPAAASQKACPKLKITAGNRFHGMLIKSEVPMQQVRIVNVAGRVICKNALRSVPTTLARIEPLTGDAGSGILLISVQFANNERVTRKVIIP